MKKILMSLLTITMVGALITGGVMAYFSDTETSTGNTFTAGTLTLDITGSNSNTGGTIPFTFANMKPGDVVTGTMTVENTGSMAGLLFGRTSYAMTAGSEDLAEVLNVTWWNDPTFGGFNPAVTLDVFASNIGPNTVEGFGPGWHAYGTLAPTASGTFEMDAEFDTSAGNEYQGSGIEVTFEYLLVQIGTPIT